MISRSMSAPSPSGRYSRMARPRMSCGGVVERFALPLRSTAMCR